MNVHGAHLHRRGGIVVSTTREVARGCQTTREVVRRFSLRTTVMSPVVAGSVRALRDTGRYRGTTSCSKRSAGGWGNCRSWEAGRACLRPGLLIGQCIGRTGITRRGDPRPIPNPSLQEPIPFWEEGRCRERKALHGRPLVLKLCLWSCSPCHMPSRPCFSAVAMPVSQTYHRQRAYSCHTLRATAP